MNQEGNQGTERASKKMRIFFSYGHRGHTEKVQIIKEALCARGHQVWIDENNIKAGNDWRRKITQGIKESQMVLAFLSKYSMRDPGVCRDELQISIGCKGGNIKAILLEPMQEVCPPATLSHSQWIDISNWNGDISESGEIIEKIIKAVETEDNFIFSDEIDLLRQILNPVTYESRIKELCAKRMFGRKWLFEILRKWDEDNRSNFFWLMGGAGFGKSMFSANLCTYLSDKVVAAQFIEWDKPHIYESTAIIKNLAFQLAKRYPDYRKFIVNLPVQTREKLCRHYSEGGYSEEELCDILFCEQAGLCIDGEHESAWVILDALDEASQNGVNTIAGTIARHLSRFPKWLKFIVTSRNDDAVQRALQGHQPNVYDLDHIIHKYQEDDMREYLQDELQGKYSDSVLNSLIRKSSGMFLYLHFACENILAQNMTAQEIENLPQGISGIYSGYFERQFSGEKFNIFVNEVRPVLELCRSAYENLSLDLLSDMLEWNKEQLLSAISYLGTLKIDREENGVQYFHLCHKSIWDWLENQRAGLRSFRVTREYGQKQLVEFCLKKIGEYKMEELIKKPVYSYPLRHVISHLIEQKNESEIWNLLGGIDPLLPRIQYDYFENYASVMESYRHAIRFYFELYAETQKPQVLPKLCRLILTYKKFFAEQQKQLQDVFAPDNSLTKALEIMEGISDIKAYFVIGCYLLSQTTKRQWNKDELIDAIVKHCGDDLDKLDYDCIDFLANGPFSDVVSELTAEQLIKILKIIDDKRTSRRILEGIQQKTTCPQLTQAQWFFDKSNKVDRGVLGSFKEFETELERIRQIDEQSDRFEALSNFAVTLCLQGKYSEACNILSEAEKNLEGGHWWSGTISDLVETYHAIGKDDNAHRTILEHKEDLTRDLFDFINLLCKCSYNKEAYQYFEEHFLTDNQECTGMLSKYVSIRELLGDLQENAQLKTAYELFQNCDSSRKDELLKFRDIQLLLARFREAGYQVEELPAEENSETPKHSLNEISNFEECFDLCSTFMAKDIPLDKQLEYIELAWNLFEKELKNQENLNDPEEKQNLFDCIRRILTWNSSEMKGKISVFVKKLLEYLELAPLDIALKQTNDWLFDGDSLLFDTLSDDDIAGYAANFEKRLLSAARNGKDDFEGLFSYYITTGNVSAAGNLLNKIPFTASDKCNIFLDALNMYDLTKIKLDSYADMVKLLAPFSNSLSSFSEFRYLFDNFCEHRELPEIVNAGKVLLEIIYPIAEQSVDVWENEQLLKAWAWLIDKSQFDKWFERVFPSESRHRRRRQDRESDKLDVLLTYVEKGSSEPENWFQDAFDRISVLNREDEKKDRLIQLLRVAILKGTSAQAEKVLSCLSNATLSANAREFRDIDIFKLYEILNCGQVSDSAVRNIIYDQNWEDLPLEKLGILAPHLLEQEKYITTWFDALWKELASHKRTDAIMEIFQSCPEFGLFTSAVTNTAVPETLTAQKLEKIYEGGLITCPNCSARVPNGKFCTECGSPLNKPVCPACGNEYQPGAKFCQECGTKL